MAGRRLVHVAEADVSLSAGMGRVAWYWREAAQRRECGFVHIGPSEVGEVRHPAWFPRAARRVYERQRQPGDCLVVHEPASGAFVDCPGLLVLSHGLERRYWELRLSGRMGPEAAPSLRTRLAFPQWRLRPAERGLRRASGVLVLNEEDAAFVRARYHRDTESVRVIRHGVRPTRLTASDVPDGPFTVVCQGTWITRKGRDVIVAVAARLQQDGVAVRWLLAGTGAAARDVRAAFAPSVRDAVMVVPYFPPDEEDEVLGQAHVWLMPSWFEGQPLGLLQAMAAGRCCVATATCGQRDVIRHDGNGLLFDIGDVEACVALVKRCASDPALRQRLGQAAAADMRGREWPAMADEALDVIEALGQR